MSYTSGQLFVEYRSDVPHRKWAVYTLHDGKGPAWTVADFENRDDAILFACAKDMLSGLKDIEQKMRQNGMDRFLGPILSLIARAEGGK
jgi:hypothetical protein